VDTVTGAIRRTHRKVGPTWEGYLISLQLNNPGITAEEITEKLKAKWPGDYTVIEYYNARRGVMDHRVKFDDPRKEMLWVLKNA
jgi:hypothetical protein